MTRAVVARPFAAITGLGVAVHTRGLEHGLHIKGLARSPLPGQDGNVEFFLWMKVPAIRAPARIGTELDAAVRNAMEQYPEPPDAEQPNKLPGVNA